MNARRSRAVRGFALACLLLCSACTAIKAKLMTDTLTEGLYAIAGYEGRVAERGILREDPRAEVVKEVIYGRLWRVRAEVVAPEEHAGELFVFDGDTISMWWPRFFFGIRVSGVQLPTRGEVTDAIRESSYWALDHYDYTSLGEGRVAARDVTVWSGAPSEDSSRCDPYWAWIDEDYAIPLKVNVKRDHRTWYRMAFTSITFRSTPPDETFAFEFPEGAVVHEWHLGDPGVTLAQAQAQVEFPILVPTALPSGHAVNKLVMSRNKDVRMVALLMESGGRWLSLSEVPNMGPIMVPELGIPVAVGAQKGILNFALGFTTVSWAVGNTALTMIGNLPYPQMLSIAASVAAPNPKTRPDRAEED